MSDNTIPDAIAKDLETHFLNHQPAGMNLGPDRVRLKVETGTMPSPRLVILTGIPRYVPKMDGTARVPVRVEYITSQDRADPSLHELHAALVDAWFRSIATNRRRQLLSSRVYLHDLIVMQPETGIRNDEREQFTAMRGDFVVTLVAP